MTFKIFSKSQSFKLHDIFILLRKREPIRMGFFFSFSFSFFNFFFFLSLLEEPIRIIIVKTYPLYNDDNFYTGEPHKEIKTI